MMTFTIALFLALGAVAQSVPASQPRPLQGFLKEGADRQRALEKQFDSFLKKDQARDWMKRLSARPHHVDLPTVRRMRISLPGCSDPGATTRRSNASTSCSLPPKRAFSK